MRARQVYDAYIDARDIEASRHVLSDKDETKSAGGSRSEFGIKTEEVTRYCKMVVWALEFEDFHRDQGRDEDEITRRTAELSQYFFELDAGRATTSWRHRSTATKASGRSSSTCCSTASSRTGPQIRELRRVYDKPEALDQLKEAHRETEQGGRAGEHVNDADRTARRQRARPPSGWSGATSSPVSRSG